MTTRLDDFEFSSDDLRQVHKFIAKSLALYQNEDIRMVNLDDFHLVHKGILDSVKFQRKLKTFTPDGITRVACKSFKAPALRAVISFTEIRNGTRKGGSNPIHQAQCDYVAFYCAEALHFFFFSFLCSELQTHDHLLFFLLTVSASSRCVLLFLIPHWYCWLLYDHLLCYFCGPFHFSALDGLYLYRRKATSWRAILQDRQSSERMHR